MARRRAPARGERRRSLVAKLLPTRSAAFRETVTLIEKVAPTDASVHLVGESGSGKDFIAEVLHVCSSRAREQFVRIECASIPSELFESELFGYERGAFTDARSAKPGKIEPAHGGTLYLDEIGSLAPAAQAKLLRFLQDGTVTRLGAGRGRVVDARTISSSNTPLQERVSTGEFRSDLLYRLQVVTVTVPPLRERLEDLPMLARSFLAGSARSHGKPVTGFTSAALSQLREYDWPGNLRELRNVIDRAVVLTDGPLIGPETLRLFDRGDAVLALARRESWTLEELERRYIAEVLQTTGSNYSRAAALLGINRKTLLEKRKRYGLD